VLKLENVSASYGSVPAISNVSIEIGEGEAVGLLGANGAGKSTTLRAISSLVKLTSGTVTLDGVNLASFPPYRIPELGIAHVPEGRQVFPEMTVHENLEIGAYVPKAKAERRQTLELVYSIFPRLAERRKQLAGTMSGGEQQMLAIARALLSKPRLLLLDEPSLGLAPKMTEAVFQMIQDLRREGLTVLLVEQKARQTLKIADRAYLMETGRVVTSGPAQALIGDPVVSETFLGGRVTNIG
jgi:branched-chain amino acid transport system ATP-binding protein